MRRGVLGVLVWMSAGVFVFSFVLVLALPAAAQLATPTPQALQPQVTSVSGETITLVPNIRTVASDTQQLPPTTTDVVSQPATPGWSASGQKLVVLSAASAAGLAIVVFGTFGILRRRATSRRIHH